MNLFILYQNHRNLQYRDQDKVNLEFIKNRFAHFFSDTSLDFIEVENLTQVDSSLLKNSHDMVVGLSLLNPLIDCDLLSKMVEYAKRHPHKIISEGEVPGTGVLFVALGEHIDKETKMYFSNLQRKYNTQINLARLKRAKIFNALLNKFPDLHTFTIEKLLDYTSSKEGTNFIVAYGEDVKMRTYKKCPFCGCKDAQALHCDESQPIIGFLTRQSEYYYLCQDCGLVYLNPHMPPEELGRYYDEYNFETPLCEVNYAEILDNLNEENTSHLSNYEAVVPFLRKMDKNAKTLDLGGGIGCFCVYIKKLFPDFNVSLMDIRIDSDLIDILKERGVNSKTCNFVQDGWDERDYDLITNWEVIEHISLDQLENYFKNVYNSLKRGGFYIFSTPDFFDPLCRALDFWASAPGEHVSVLSRKALEPILMRCGFTVVDELHESVTIKTAGRWFGYGADNNSNMASRGESFVINDLLSDKNTLTKIRKNFRQKKVGSELILILKKD